MLELPEAEVLRKDLDKEIVGKRVKAATIRTPGVVKPFHRTRPELVKALEGRKVTAARRRGRTILLDLDEDRTWVIDPGEQGSLHRETATQSPGSDTHLAVTFTTGGALHLSAHDATSVHTGVAATDEVLDVAGIAPDALDPLDDNPTWMEFGRYLHAAKQPLKLLLIDQDRIVGLGPVYSDEILWEAGLRHDRPSASLSTQEIRRLYRAMQEVITAGMKAASSTLDESDPDHAVDDEGSVADHLRVYGRDGQPCPRCRRTIQRTRIKRGIYTYHCAQCMI